MRDLGIASVRRVRWGESPPPTRGSLCAFVISLEAQPLYLTGTVATAHTVPLQELPVFSREIDKARKFDSADQAALEAEWTENLGRYAIVSV